jgi:hypothetical protein
LRADPDRVRVQRAPGRLALALAVLAIGAGTLVPVALADGDPASDVLYFQDVFLPAPEPSTETSAPLKSTVGAAKKAGFKIKVAIIASRQDLGAVPSLFGRPQLYAQFLGLELQSFYKQRLLVVMPSGFGVFRNGKPVAAEKRALKGLKAGATADELTAAATQAVQRLRKALAGKK